MFLLYIYSKKAYQNKLINIYIITSSFESKFCSIKKIAIQLNQLITVKNNEVLRWDIPLSNKMWCKWFLSAVKGDFLFNNLTNITLKVSNTGIEIIEIAITGIFSSRIEKTLANFEVGALVI